MADPINIIPLPSHDQILEYLVLLYFSDGRRKSDVLQTPRDYIDLCVRRAYLDVSRTLHGIGTVRGFDELRKEVGDKIQKSVAQLLEDNPIADQSAFDLWHEQLCKSLMDLYAKRGYRAFTVGQAQKWVNMTLKYIICLGSVGVVPRIDRDRLFLVAHAPLDNLFLEALKERQKGYPDEGELRPWSRIKRYDIYLKFQEWLRKPENRPPATSGSPPLAVEFELFLRKL